MKRPNERLAFISFCLAVTTVLLAARIASATSRPKIRILTTVFPLLEFAREVAGDRGDVRMLLPPGSDVHTWQPRFSDIEKLTSADMFIYIGPALEPWAQDILRSTARPGLRIVEAGRGLQVFRSEHGEPGHVQGKETADPHIWLDFGLDQVVVDRILSAIKEIEPENSAAFERAAALYKERLGELDDEYREAFKNCLHRTFIFGGHSAFGYLARRYGLQMISVYGLSPDASPTPKELVGIIDKAKKGKVKTIFFEPSVGDKLARIIASEIGADIRLLNPGHSVAKETLESRAAFIDLMRKNLESFKHGLICR